MVIAGRLDHVAIAADNTDAMVKWYEETLGLVIHAVAEPKPSQTQKTYLIGPPVPRGSRSPSEGIHHGMMIEVMPKNTAPRNPAPVRTQASATSPGTCKISTPPSPTSKQKTSPSSAKSSKPSAAAASSPSPTAKET